MDCLENIKELIEKNIVFIRKNRIVEEDHKLNTYFNIGKLILEAQGGKELSKYGNGL